MWGLHVRGNKNSMNCPQCGVLNDPANQFCSACGESLKATDGPPAAKSAPLVFRDPKRLTAWLQLLLIGIIVLEMAFAASQLAEAREGSARELLQTIFGIGLFVFYIATVVMFCVWTYRVNANIHALGAANLRFTPGWAVGWYFVPIANLWKPYQVMKEIWRASKNPSGWQDEASSSIVGWWWFWWIVSNVEISIGSSPEQEMIPETAITPFGLILVALDVIATVFAYRVVKQVGILQAEASDRSVSAIFA
jgi:hypothetical protein